MRPKGLQTALAAMENACTFPWNPGIFHCWEATFISGARKPGPMRRALLAAALVALVAAVPSSASFLEDTLAPAGVTYQEDASVHGDAPATCEDLDPARAVAFDADASWGMLVDYDDEADAYALALTEATVGTRVGFSIGFGEAAETSDVAFDIRSPDCGSSVFDAGSAYYDPAPAEPYPNPPNGGQVEARLTGYACDERQWKFLANQMGGIPAPDTIYVEWTDGSYEYVAVDKSTPATVAMYRTGSHLDVTVARAVIVLPADYDGQFKIASGPCSAVEGVRPVDPVHEPRSGEFTVQEAGTHVIVVTITRRAADKVQDSIPGPPTATAATCHYSTCLAAVGSVSFNMLTAPADS